jgi:hypothetical protein
MFKKQLLIFSGVMLLLIITLGSCKSKYEKLKASNDNAKKYQEAVKFYNKKDYSKALGLFEDLVTRYRGRAEAEDFFTITLILTISLRITLRQGSTLKLLPILIHRARGPRSAALLPLTVFTWIRLFTRLIRRTL